MQSPDSAMSLMKFKEVLNNPTEMVLFGIILFELFIVLAFWWKLTIVQGTIRQLGFHSKSQNSDIQMTLEYKENRPWDCYRTPGLYIQMLKDLESQATYIRGIDGFGEDGQFQFVLLYYDAEGTPYKSSFSSDEDEVYVGDTPLFGPLILDAVHAKWPINSSREALVRLLIGDQFTEMEAPSRFRTLFGKDHDAPNKV